MALCIIWTVLFLAVEYTIVAPAEKAGMPCDCQLYTRRGNNTDVCCHACAEDPLCLGWSSALAASSPLLSICPTGAKTLADTTKNTAFSCLADGFWMLVTTVFALAWFAIVRCRRPPTLATADPAASKGVALGP